MFSYLSDIDCHCNGIQGEMSIIKMMKIGRRKVGVCIITPVALNHKISLNEGWLVP